MRPFFDLIASSQGNQQWEAMGLDTLADALAAFIFESAHLADRVDGDPREPSPEEMKEIGNMVIFSTFTPATSFGQKVSGKILVGSRHINIRG